MTNYRRADIDYIYYNPVKHGHIQEPGEWPFTTYHKYLSQGFYGSREKVVDRLKKASTDMKNDVGE